MTATNDPRVDLAAQIDRMWRTPAFRDITQNRRIREGSLISATLPADLEHRLVERRRPIRAVLL